MCILTNIFCITWDFMCLVGSQFHLNCSKDTWFIYHKSHLSSAFKIKSPKVKLFKVIVIYSFLLWKIEEKLTMDLLDLNEEEVDGQLSSFSSLSCWSVALLTNKRKQNVSWERSEEAFVIEFIMTVSCWPLLFATILHFWNQSPRSRLSSRKWKSFLDSGGMPAQCPGCSHGRGFVLIPVKINNP